MIQISEVERSIVLDILKKFVPDSEIRVFGSRYRGNSRSSSDLDIAIVAKSRLSNQLLFELEDAFQESDLPFRVDILDWHALSAEFKCIIEEGYDVLPIK